MECHPALSGADCDQSHPEHVRVAAGVVFLRRHSRGDSLESQYGWASPVEGLAGPGYVHCRGLYRHYRRFDSHWKPDFGYLAGNRGSTHPLWGCGGIMSNGTITTRFTGLFTRRKRKIAERGEEFYRAGQWQLVWWKFRRHKLANFSLAVLMVFYFLAVFAEFMAPYIPLHRHKNFVTKPPSSIQIRDANGQWRLPFVYGATRSRDPITMRPVFEEDRSIIYPINFFVRGDEYRFWGLF